MLRAVSPPRDCILTVARDLFCRHGIHAVGVEIIAEAAGTNKMTLYRHFASKDALIAEWMARRVVETVAEWDRIAIRHGGDPLAQLRAWVRYVGEFKPGDCAFANAVAELSDKDHPARRVIMDHKTQIRERLIRLCEEAHFAEPDSLADTLFLLCERARISLQSVGSKGPASRLVSMLEGLYCRSG